MTPTEETADRKALRLVAWLVLATALWAVAWTLVPAPTAPAPVPMPTPYPCIGGR